MEQDMLGMWLHNNLRENVNYIHILTMLLILAPLLYTLEFYVVLCKFTFHFTVSSMHVHGCFVWKAIATQMRASFVQL